MKYELTKLSEEDGFSETKNMIYTTWFGWKNEPMSPTGLTDADKGGLKFER